MADLPKTIVKFATELVKYYAEKVLGKGASAILIEELTDLVGESATEKIEAFLDQGEKAKQILSAFEEADACFVASIEDQELKEAIISLPFRGIQNLEGFALQLPSTLDDRALLEAIKEQFSTDWPERFTTQQLDYAAQLFLKCLNRALAIKCGQILPAIFITVTRIDETTQQTLSTQQVISNQIKIVGEKIDDQNDILLQKVGVATSLLISSQIAQPDGAPLHTSNYLVRKDLIEQLIEDLRFVIWIALIDGPGKGKTQLTLSIYDEYRDPFRYWISLRSQGDQSLYHFREQVIRWFIQLKQQPDLWLPYISGQVPFQAIIKTIAEMVKKNGILIIDDIPEFAGQEKLYEELEITTKVFLANGVKIITTGQWSLPPLLNVQSPSSLLIRSCPYFSSEEVRTLLENATVSSKLKTDKVAIWITAMTKGHPSLVNATIKWLEQQGTQVSLATYDGLITGEPLKDVLEHSRLLLIRPLSDYQKELLYRLSLINEKFNKKIVMDIAAINPPIRRPGETLDYLIGPWLERSSNDYFEVTPLLANSGKDNLLIDIQREIHLLVADQYLSKKTIDIRKANSILVHLWQAHDYLRFSSTLIQLLLAVKTSSQATYIDWACVIFNDVGWPDEINLGLRIMIRAAQVRTLALAGEKYTKINDDLDNLLSKANTNEVAPAILFAYVNAGLVNEDLPVEISIPRSFTILGLLKNAPKLKDALSNELIDQLPNAIWSQGMRVKNQDQIKLFLEYFCRLSDIDRNSLVEASFAIEVSTHLMDQSWFFEASKPEGQRNWQSVLSFLDEIAQYSCIQSYMCFQVAIARARGVIFADYLRQVDKAIEILEGLAGLTEHDALFQVNYSMGCFASDAGLSAQAIKYFNKAEMANGLGFSFYRMDNTIRLGIENSRQKEWVTAKGLIIQSIHRLARSEGKDIFRMKRLELLGELAFIYWSNGELARVCGSMYGYIMGLVKEKDIDDPLYKEAFNKAGHGLGWWVSIAGTGKPPNATLNGGEYAAVKAGMFGIRRERLADHVPHYGFSKALLLNQLAMLADSAYLRRTSWKLYKLARNHYQNEQNTNNLEANMLYLDLTGLEVEFGNPKEAIMYAISSIKTFAIMRVIGRKKDGYAHTLYHNSYTSEITDEDYQIAEKQLVHTLFAPVFSHLISRDWSTEEIRSRLSTWKSLVIQHKKDLIYSDEWLNVLNYFGDLIHYWKEDIPIDEEYGVFGEKTIFTIFRYILSSDKSKVSLKEAYQNQLSGVISLAQFGQSVKHTLPGIGRFIHRYWFDIARNRRFAIKNPQEFIDDLMAINPYLGGVTLEGVLKRASQALGLSVPSDALNKLDEVKKISRPWDFKSEEPC